MNIDTGLSTKDAQYAICKGTYGDKHWSSGERQAACQKYEQLTGTKIDTGNRFNNGLLMVGIGVVIVLVSAVVVITVLRRNKSHASSKSTKR